MFLPSSWSGSSWTPPTPALRLSPLFAVYLPAWLPALFGLTLFIAVWFPDSAPCLDAAVDWRWLLPSEYEIWICVFWHGFDLSLLLNIKVWDSALLDWGLEVSYNRLSFYCLWLSSSQKVPLPAVLLMTFSPVAFLPEHSPVQRHLFTILSSITSFSPETVRPYHHQLIISTCASLHLAYLHHCVS